MRCSGEKYSIKSFKQSLLNSFMQYFGMRVDIFINLMNESRKAAATGRLPTVGLQNIGS